jgi:hypothetical protein
MPDPDISFYLAQWLLISAHAKPEEHGLKKSDFHERCMTEKMMVLLEIVLSLHTRSSGS